MNLIAWQATIQNELGNVVPNAVVTVRDKGTGSLSTIYDSEGAPIGNPITSDLDGFVKFYARPGSYLIEGAFGGENTAEWEAALLDVATLGDLTILDDLVDIPRAWANAAVELVADLRTGGVWDKLRYFRVPALGPIVGGTDLKNPTAEPFVAPSGVEWVPGFGIWADGDTVVDSRFNPVASGLSANNWHLSVYLPDNLDRVRVYERTITEGDPPVIKYIGKTSWGFGSDLRPMAGSADGRLRIIPMGTAQTIRVANGAESGTTNVNLGSVLSVQTHLGHSLYNSDGVTFTGYRNGVFMGSGAVHTPYLPNSNLQLLGAGFRTPGGESEQRYNFHPLAMVTFGERLTAEETKVLADSSRKFMLAIGADKAQVEVKPVRKPQPLNSEGPARVVDFARGIGLEHVTYSRSGETTVMDRSGRFVPVAANTMPIAAGGISRQIRGLETYGGFTQHEANSQAFSDSSYVKTGVTIGAASGVFGLDGSSSNVSTMTANGVSGEHSISRTYTGLNRYVCAQAWIKEPSAASRSSEIIALRITHDGVVNWAIMNKATRQVVTFGDGVTLVNGVARAGQVEDWYERTQIYLAVDTGVTEPGNVQVSLVVIDPAYPMDGSNPASFAVNTRADVTNLLGWQVVSAENNLDNYPRPYLATAGAVRTVGDHNTTISLAGLDTSQDFFVFLKFRNTFVAAIESSLMRIRAGSTAVGSFLRSSPSFPTRINNVWLPADSSQVDFVTVADNVPDIANVSLVIGRTPMQSKQYRASNDRVYNENNRTSWNLTPPTSINLCWGDDSVGSRQFAAIVERVEIWTTRPSVSDVESRVHFDGGLYGYSPFVDLETQGFEGVWQPWLGMRPTTSGTQPVIERMLAHSYNTAGSVVTGTDQVAYCGGGAGYALRQIGLFPPNNLWASSFTVAGPSVGLDPANWKRWDVVMTRRNDGENTADRVGHVTFFWDVFTINGRTYVLTVGANQNESQIGPSTFALESVIDVRRSTFEYAQTA